MAPSSSQPSKLEALGGGRAGIVIVAHDRTDTLARHRMWAMESILEYLECCLHNYRSGSGCRKKSDLSLVNTVENYIHYCTHTHNILSYIYHIIYIHKYTYTQTHINTHLAAVSLVE